MTKKTRTKNAQRSVNWCLRAGEMNVRGTIFTFNAFSRAGGQKLLLISLMRWWAKSLHKRGLPSGMILFPKKENQQHSCISLDTIRWSYFAFWDYRNIIVICCSSHYSHNQQWRSRKLTDILLELARARLNSQSGWPSQPQMEDDEDEVNDRFSQGLPASIASLPQSAFPHQDSKDGSSLSSSRKRRKKEAKKKEKAEEGSFDNHDDCDDRMDVDGSSASFVTDRIPLIGERDDQNEARAKRHSPPATSREVEGVCSELQELMKNASLMKDASTVEVTKRGSRKRCIGSRAGNYRFLVDNTQCMTHCGWLSRRRLFSEQTAKKRCGEGFTARCGWGERVFQSSEFIYEMDSELHTLSKRFSFILKTSQTTINGIVCEVDDAEDYDVAIDRSEEISYGRQLLKRVQRRMLSFILNETILADC